MYIQLLQDSVNSELPFPCVQELITFRENLYQFKPTLKRVLDKESFSSVKVYDHSWVSDIKDDEEKWSVNDSVRQRIGLTNSVFLRLYETNQLLKLSIGAQCD